MAMLSKEEVRKALEMFFPEPTVSARPELCHIEPYFGMVQYEAEGNPAYRARVWYANEVTYLRKEAKGGGEFCSIALTRLYMFLASRCSVFMVTRHAEEMSQNIRDIITSGELWATAVLNEIVP